MNSKKRVVACGVVMALPSSLVISGRASSCCLALAALVSSLPLEVVAQERYDDHEIADRISVSLGAYYTARTNSTIQVTSKRTGFGAIVDAEDFLGVEQSVMVARLDGHYRFNRAHRFEWTYFDQTRNGLVALKEDLEVGDLVFPVGYSLATEWNLRLIKASYAWSFINTQKYEFYLGGGLNLRSTALRLRGERNVNGSADVRTYDERADLPLPTATLGLKYRLTDRLAFDVRSETFFLEISDSSGRLQDNFFLVNYRIGQHVGIGGGVNFFSFDLQTDFGDDDELSSYTNNIGFQLFVSARF